jgi:hypothetical protein
MHCVLVSKLRLLLYLFELKTVAEGVYEISWKNNDDTSSCQITWNYFFKKKLNFFNNLKHFLLKFKISKYKTISGHSIETKLIFLKFKNFFFTTDLQHAAINNNQRLNKFCESEGEKNSSCNQHRNNACYMRIIILIY